MRCYLRLVNPPACYAGIVFPYIQGYFHMDGALKVAKGIVDPFHVTVECIVAIAGKCDLKKRMTQAAAQ